ncbi:MAG: aspartate aminotransferase family protein [Candidatus Melainabacteria bacterium]|nr:aspartate aminotransferase family protein [Candidatus Melainabacteria bacterium]
MSEFFFRNLKKNYPTVASAKGVRITDTDGRSYLDACSGAIVANLGHGLSEITDAINEQLQKVAFAHTSQFVSEAGLELAKKVVEMTPPGFKKGARAYFMSGGSEAVETAIKMARSYFVHQGDNQRTICFSRWQSYHGSTFGALSVTGHPARRKPYVPMLRSPSHISADYRYRCMCGFGPGCCASDECSIAHADELEAAIVFAGPENVMAFIAEPIVGATLGAAVPGRAYFPRIREICNKYGILLIADEVMTGLGRTGTTFGMNHFDVEPDIIALGKGMAAGYQPLAAVLGSGRVVKAFEDSTGVFEHGFTYSAHPVSCAAGLAAIDYVQKHDLINKVSQREHAFFKQASELLKTGIIGDIRGKGFMMGLEFVKNVDTKEPFSADLRVSQLVAQEAMKNGLLVYPGSGFIDGVNGDHIMIAPPFTVSDDEMSEIFELLERSLNAVAKLVGSGTAR